MTEEPPLSHDPGSPAPPDSDDVPVTETESDPSPPAEESAPRRGLFGEYGRIVLYALFIALFIKVFFIEAFGIPTPSMRETLLVGDYLFVNKFIYGLRTPRAIPLTGIRIPHVQILPGLASVQRGDVVVFEFPGGGGMIEQPSVMNYVKRCVALPGDTVELAGKRLYVNGERRAHPSTARADSRALGRGDFDISIYPKGASFNRDWWGPMVVPFDGMEIELTLENV
ncbi:MAG: signal peptidase I, partial [Bacteroidetes bacterium]|nr:signal peptidase I [Bacteroidota bacterium]